MKHKKTKNFDPESGYVSPKSTRSRLIRRGAELAVMAGLFSGGVATADSHPKPTVLEYVAPATPEQLEADYAHQTIELNEAKPLKHVITSSGIGIDFWQAGLGNQQSITIDEPEIDKVTKFVIDNLSNVDQTFIPVDRIRQLQQAAGQGGLGNIEITAVLSTDTTRCILGDSTGKMIDQTFRQTADGQNCYGIGLENDSRIDTVFHQPTLLVGVSEQYPFTNVVTPPHTSPTKGGDGSAAEAGVLQSPSQVMTSVFAHELAHSLIGAMGQRQNYPEQEHGQVVFPIMDRVNALLCQLPATSAEFPSTEIVTAFHFGDRSMK